VLVKSILVALPPNPPLPPRPPVIEWALFVDAITLALTLITASGDDVALLAVK
jgi:hypothetical protein